MKNKIAFISGIFIYVFMALIMSSYDNQTMHKYINETIAETFLKAIPADATFKNYFFHPSTKMKGTGVVAPGYYYHTEGNLDLTFKEWLIHGGYSADEPELLQALRHFYDPKGIDAGKRYLTDFPPGLSVTNPYVDILSWALEYNGEVVNGTTGANYLYQENSWEDGKRSFLLAMKETDKIKQDKLMAHAWRCLGETLHALGDMTCPVHVRNDGHPTGDADPYENGIKLSSYLPSNPASFWDQALINKIKGEDSIRQIFHDMALYTNENFFTNQTIYGSGVAAIQPVIRPTNPYPLPFAKESGNGWDYVNEEFTFYKTFGSNKIKMCKDRYYFAIATNFRTKAAYVDLDVAISQSQVLLSNFIGIAPEVIKRYIPQITVSIDNVSTDFGEIYGSVAILSNAEYPFKNIYNALVTVSNYTTGKSVVVKAANGFFSTSELAFSEGDEIQAYISIGGFQVYSEKYKTGSAILKQFIEKSNDVFLSFDLKKVQFSDGSVMNAGFLSNPKNDGQWDQVLYQLSGQNLIIKKGYSKIENGDTGNKNEEYKIHFSSNFDKITSIEFSSNYVYNSSTQTYTEKGSFIIEGINHEYWNGIPGGSSGLDFSRYTIQNNNGFQVALKDFTYEQTTLFKSDNYTVTRKAQSIDWVNLPLFEFNSCALWFSKSE